MALVALGMASCTYPTYVTYEEISGGDSCKFHKKTIDLAVSKDKWDFDKSTNQFFCHFEVPELTAQVYDYGEVSVNREYNSGTQRAYQVALPETSYKVEQDGENTFYYAQLVDYAYGVGFIEVFYTISDYFYPEGFTPEGMVFRAQLTY